MTITCHISACSRGATGQPGSISHPRSQLGASVPAHMCCADGRQARAAAASPVHAPCTLAVQPICMFTAAICPGLLNVCSQKYRQTEKLEVKKSQEARARMLGLPSPSAFRWPRALLQLDKDSSPARTWRWAALGPCSSADFPQRLHRFGQTNPVFIFNVSSFSYLAHCSHQLLARPTPIETGKQ